MEEENVFIKIVILNIQKEKKLILCHSDVLLLDIVDSLDQIPERHQFVVFLLDRTMVLVNDVDSPKPIVPLTDSGDYVDALHIQNVNNNNNNNIINKR